MARAKAHRDLFLPSANRRARSGALPEDNPAFRNFGRWSIGFRAARRQLTEPLRARRGCPGERV
jgi:hypothetical protein